MLTTSTSNVARAIALLCVASIHAQMQFEIPAEMLQGGYGGGGQQQRQVQQQPQLKWPRHVSSEVTFLILTMNPVHPGWTGASVARTVY